MDIERIKQINPSIVKDDGTIQSFKEQLFDLEHGLYDFTLPMVITPSSEYLSFMGNEDPEKPVLINPRKIMKIRAEHFLTISDLADLEYYLKGSGLAFESLTQGTSRVVVIDKEDEVGDQIIAACRLDAESAFLSVNQITSIYGKENFMGFVERTFEADKVFFCNEKTETFVKSPRLQLPNSLINALSIMDYKGSFNRSQIMEMLIEKEASTPVLEETEYISRLSSDSSIYKDSSAVKNDVRYALKQMPATEFASFFDFSILAAEGGDVMNTDISYQMTRAFSVHGL